MLGRNLISWLAALIVLTMLAGGQRVAPQAASQVTAAPTAAGTVAPLTFGPGSFNLPPSVGLAGLSDYQATLKVEFNGNEAGNPNPWTQTLNIIVNGKPPARALTATFTGSAPAAAYIAPWSAVSQGLFYRSAKDGSCIASEIEAQTGPDMRSPVWEPADFLPGVIGAEESGAKKLNGIAAKGYKFDERALGVADRAKATGEVWVADPGGYVLKYNLTLKGGADYFGEGGDGTLTWAYDLTKPAKPTAVALPKDCPPGLVDAPVMDDAKDVQRLPGVTLFTTHATMQQIVDFYKKQLAASGWILDGQPDIGSKAAIALFKQGKVQLQVVITASDEGTTVRLVSTSQNSAE